MARQDINLGAAPTGVGGDTTRSTGVKINAMTQEIYDRLAKLGSASNAALVGTVAQSGGVSTGAIIERGSNANGQFTKYADGTLICWDAVGFSAGTTVGAGSIFQSPPVPARSFPATFASPPKILITASCALAVSVCAISGDGNAPSWPPTLCQGPYNTGSTFYQGIMNYLAIGRWY